MNKLLGTLFLGSLVAGLSGCRTLDRFDTSDGAAYCGSIVAGAFVRQGYPPNLRLRLTIDTAHLHSTPGTLTTDDGASGPCAPAARFDAATLQASEEVQNDPLSTLDFGTGRDENLVTWVESSCEGPTLAIVSLMKNDDVEVRLLRPPPATAGGDPQPAGFALFQLSRREDGDCGF